MAPRPCGDLAGRGWPDPEIIPLCDALNALPGVCTLQSCAGHAAGSRHRPNGEFGLLWLWLDEGTSQELDRFGNVLARLPGIETVSKRYADWGQEITAIEFDGRFEEACKSIVIFFSALAAISGSSLRGPWPDIRCPIHRT